MIKNPSYLNSSIWDTLSGEFYRSFKKKKDYFYIYDYWKWDEGLIEDKKVIEKDHSPQETEQLEIMYLPNDPSVSRITENLESLEFNRFLTILFMVVVFIFSAVFIFSFYQTVFNA